MLNTKAYEIHTVEPHTGLLHRSVGLNKKGAHAGRAPYEMCKLVSNAPLPSHTPGARIFA